MDWEVGRGGAQSRDEVIFKSADGAFGSVASVRVGRDELMVNVFLFHPVFDEFGALVVKEMETRATTGVKERGVGDA